MFNLIKRQKFGSPDKMIVRLRNGKIDHSIRLGSECTEIIVGTTCFVFTTTRNFPRRKLFLFSSVKRDVVKYLTKHKDIILPPERTSSEFNFDYDDSYGKITGTDLNHAYWRIAYVKGLISQKTYEHGLDPECKALRLATISVLGREKSFKKFEREQTPEGDYELVMTEEIVVQHADLIQKKVFKYIRLVCFNMMYELSKKLGDDFDCWKTDCIYYRDTPENRKLVQDYFIKKNMDFKQLDFFEDEK